MSGRAQFPLAGRLRGGGAPLGEVFSFLSGLYFRGKLAYATAFARPARAVPGVLVITPNQGLCAPEETVTLAGLRAFAAVPIDESDPRYRDPLLRDARRIVEAAGRRCEMILLGSVASGKYVDVLGEVFGDRLLFPREFAGRGDMSRGGLCLRCVAEGRELEYVRPDVTNRHGPRPPRLPPRRAVPTAP